MEDKCPFCGAESTGGLLSYGCGSHATRIPLSDGEPEWHISELCKDRQIANLKEELAEARKVVEHWERFWNMNQKEES